jgi:hypothetical protein
MFFLEHHKAKLAIDKGDSIFLLVIISIKNNGFCKALLSVGIPARVLLKIGHCHFLIERLDNRKVVIIVIPLIYE